MTAEASQVTRAAYVLPNPVELMRRPFVTEQGQLDGAWVKFLTGLQASHNLRLGLETTLEEGYQPLDADLTVIGGLDKTDGNFIVADGSAWTVESGATARSSLGLGALATLSTVGTAQIDDDSVTLAKMAEMATDSFLGRDTAGAGNPEVLSVATTLAMLGISAGTWTPAMAYAVPGTSTFSYSSQVGQYFHAAGLVVALFALNVTPTIGTGSGAVTISLPFAATDNFGGSIVNINDDWTWPAGITAPGIRAAAGASVATLCGFGSAVNRTDFQASNMTSGNAHVISALCIYRTT